MHTYIIKKDCSSNDCFYYSLMSDLHIGSKGLQKDILENDFKKAIEYDADIFLNGDIGEFIIPKDQKRYNASGDKYGADNHINRTIDEITEFLKPYAQKIQFIGMGNHETAVLKHNGIDPISIILYNLEKETGANIAHGQYNGFTRFSYKLGESKGVDKKSTFTMYDNHGQGGKAEITKGAIDLSRHMSNKQADLIWLGHKHTKMLLPSEPVIYMDKSGNIKEKYVCGVITGSYKRNAKQYDAKKDGYSLSYGEECFRTGQSTGGIIMKHSFRNKNFNVVANFII